MKFFKKLLGYPEEETFEDFGKKIESKVKSVDRIKFFKMGSEVDPNAAAEKIKEGIPVVITLEGMENEEANRILAFFSGVVFGINAEVKKISKYVFLFSAVGNFEDGTLDSFYNEFRNKEGK